jgi:hypothetical protein
VDVWSGEELVLLKSKDFLSSPAIAIASSRIAIMDDSEFLPAGEVGGVLPT